MSSAILKKLEASTILRAEVGSNAWGLNLGEQSDRDEMGICIEAFEQTAGFSEFDQLVYRSAEERSGRPDEPSQPGDLDLTLYSLRKWLRLALKGNPTILTLLFSPPEKWVSGDARGSNLQKLAPKIISRQAGKAFLGYMQAQRQRLTGERGGRHGIFEEGEGGYDGKYAMHMLRLGYQGIELLNTGRVTLPMPEEPRSFLLGVRQGHSTTQEVLTRAGELEAELKDLLDASPLPPTPDYSFVQDWMLEVYWSQWNADYGDKYQRKFREMVRDVKTDS